MRTWRGVVGAVLCFAALGARIPSAGAVDEVLSGSIREADNTTGQNTNAGAGIKTNHIQNSAVTSVKIKDGSVTGADLAANAVTSAKIRDGNVLAADLADGAVTASKIGFYSRVIVVDINGGGDFASPVAAMAAVATMIPAPSAAAPVLVRIMPGVYDVGTSSVQMQSFVDIEGSGEEATRITGTAPYFAGTVRGASAAQIRFLTVENTSDDIRPVAFLAPLDTTPSLLHVTARAASPTQGGAGAYSFGVYCAVGSAPTLSHVTAIAGGGDRTAAVYSDSAAPRLEDVDATGRDGSVFNIGVSLSSSSGAVLRRVAATASGPSGGTVGNVGIYVGVSSPVISDSTALALGSTARNTGVRNEGECRTRMANVTARALDALAMGMENVAQGDGTADQYGIVVDRSTFEGATSAVNSDREFTVSFGASKLLGGPAAGGGGTLRCVASYDASYKALLPDCSNCIPASGVFTVTGGTFADTSACQVAGIGQAAAVCCSGFATMQYEPDPLFLCAGTCN
ncbi:MAG TPA: hypothetical protein VI078_15885 [bacterium]